MATFPEFLRFRQSLMSDIPQLPGLLGNPVPPRPAQPQAPAPQPQQGGGISNVLGRIFGGSDDPNLSPEQNQQARKDALLQAGLSILASDKRGLQAVGEGGLAGQQAGAQARQVIYGRTQTERIEQALKDPTITNRLTPEQLALIRVSDPREAIQILTKAAFAGPGEAKVVGNALVSADGRVLYQGANVSTDTEAQLRAMGVNPLSAKPEDWAKANEAIIANKERVAKAGSSTINVGPQETKVQGYLGELYGKTQDAANAAGAMNDQLDAMGSLVDQGMASGSVEAATLPLRQLGASLGIADADKVGKQQLFQALSNSMALKARQNMPGALSDNDINFLKQQVPSLWNTPEGNKRVLETLRAVNNRAIQVAAEMDRYRLSHGGSLDGWQEYLRNWANANPLFYKRTPF